MDPATKKLLKDHQAIIDAWFAEWREQERARIDAAFERAKARGLIQQHPEIKTGHAVGNEFPNGYDADQQDRK